jgi:hypothetical protein
MLRTEKIGRVTSVTWNFTRPFPRTPGIDISKVFVP